MAAQVLETGQPAAHRNEALSVLPLCGSLVTGAMQHLWSIDTLPEHELGPLAFASITNLSDAMVRTLVQTAGSVARPTLVRVTALSALVSVAYPRYAVEPNMLLKERPEGAKIFIPYLSHARSQFGRGGLTVSPGHELDALVERLADDPNPEVRRAARTLSDGLDITRLRGGKVRQ